jgi:spermidine synthase
MRLTHEGLQGVFRTVQAYTAPIPSYLGGVMCFVLASEEGPEVSAPRRAKLPEAAIPGMGYYTPEIHAAAFQLPPYIAALTRRVGNNT